MRTLLLVAGIFLIGVTCGAGTNLTAVASVRALTFSQPAMELREVHSRISLKTEQMPTLADFQQHFDTLLVPVGAEKYVSWVADQWVKPPVKQEGGFYNWAKDKVFPEPEVVQFGHVGVGGGIVTAVKRKNPLALINSLPFVLYF